MKKIAVILLIITLGAGAAYAQPQQRGIGIGAIVGEPTGVSLKKWMDERQAIDAAIAYSFEGKEGLHLHASWLWHDFTLIEPARGAMPVYFGIGGRFTERDGGDNRVGIRFPIGLAYHMEDLPLEFFGELAPIFDVSPDTTARLNAAVGARWYF